MRADILLLSETIRREQEAEMGKQKESHDSLIGGLGDLDVRQAFSFSQMLFIDELTASKKSHLTFCDFLEGLASKYIFEVRQRNKHHIRSRNYYLLYYIDLLVIEFTAYCSCLHISLCPRPPYFDNFQ